MIVFCDAVLQLLHVVALVLQLPARSDHWSSFAIIVEVVFNFLFPFGDFGVCLPLVIVPTQSVLGQ